MYTLMIGHRIADRRRRRDQQAWWRVTHSNAVLAARESLGFSGYSQVHQVASWHPLYLLLRATRSRLPVWLARRLNKRPPLQKAAPMPEEERWDVLEIYTFSERAALERWASADEVRTTLHTLSQAAHDQRSHSGSLMAEVLTVTPEPVAQVEKVTTALFIRALPGQSREQLQDYWRSKHQTLVLSLHQALRYRDYAQCHVVDEPALKAVLGGTQASAGVPCDGVAILSYSSWLALLLAALNPRTLIANFRLVGDETAFLDHRRSTLRLGRHISFKTHPGL